MYDKMVFPSCRPVSFARLVVKPASYNLTSSRHPEKETNAADSSRTLNAYSHLVSTAVPVWFLLCSGKLRTIAKHTQRLTRPLGIKRQKYDGIVNQGQTKDTNVNTHSTSGYRRQVTDMSLYQLRSAIAARLAAGMSAPLTPFEEKKDLFGSLREIVSGIVILNTQEKPRNPPRAFIACQCVCCAPIWTFIRYWYDRLVGCRVQNVYEYAWEWCRIEKPMSSECVLQLHNDLLRRQLSISLVKLWGENTRRSGPTERWPKKVDSIFGPQNSIVNLI